MFRKGSLVLLFLAIFVAVHGKAWANSCAVLFGGSEVPTSRFTAVDRALALVIDVMSRTSDGDLHKAFPLGFLTSKSQNPRRLLVQEAMSGERGARGVLGSFSGEREAEPNLVHVVLARVASTHLHFLLTDQNLWPFGLDTSTSMALKTVGVHTEYQKSRGSKVLPGKEHPDYLSSHIDAYRHDRDQVFEVAMLAAREARGLKVGWDSADRMNEFYRAAVIGADFLQMTRGHLGGTFSDYRGLDSFDSFMRETGRQISILTDQTRELEKYARGFPDLTLPNVRDWQLLDWLRNGMVLRVEDPMGMVQAANSLADYRRSFESGEASELSFYGVLEASKLAFITMHMEGRLLRDQASQVSSEWRRDINIKISGLESVGSVKGLAQVPSSYRELIETFWYTFGPEQIVSLVYDAYQREARVQGLDRWAGERNEEAKDVVWNLTRLWLIKSELDYAAELGGMSLERKRALEEHARDSMGELQETPRTGLPSSMRKDLKNLETWIDGLEPPAFTY